MSEIPEDIKAEDRNCVTCAETVGNLEHYRLKLYEGG
jgi:hypothetical protein